MLFVVGQRTPWYLARVARNRRGSEDPKWALPGASITRAPDLIRSQVADYLRQAIVDRRLRPGQVLVERDLCEATTASRGSVREALRQLETEGLVVSEPGRGTSVATLSEEQARHIYQVRAALEGLAGGLFAANATEEDFGALKASVDKMAGLTDQPAELLQEKDAFYEILFDGAGNPELRTLLHMLHRRITLARSTSLAVKGRPAQSVVEIQAILDAAQARDPERTAVCCIDHVRAAARTALGTDLPSPTYQELGGSAMWTGVDVFPAKTTAAQTDGQ